MKGKYNMKMKKMIFLASLLLLFCTIIILSGCAGGDGISTKKLKADINEEEQIQNLFTSDYTLASPYSVSNVEIIKEQINTENKEDIIYCDITVSNDYFSVDFSAKCIYGFYEKGGWILDEFTVESPAKAQPLRAPDSDLAYEAISKSFRYGFDCLYKGENNRLDKNGTVKITGSSLSKNTNTAKINASYHSKTLDANGYYLFEFTENGWVCAKNENKNAYMTVEDFTANYTSALGRFDPQSNIEPYMTLMGYLNILDIGNDYIKYDLQYEWVNNNYSPYFTNPYDDVFVRTGSGLTAKFNALTGSFEIGYNRTMSEVRFELHYDPTTGTWKGDLYESFLKN